MFVSISPCWPSVYGSSQLRVIEVAQTNPCMRVRCTTHTFVFLCKQFANIYDFFNQGLWKLREKNCIKLIKDQSSTTQTLTVSGTFSLRILLKNYKNKNRIPPCICSTNLCIKTNVDI